MGFGDFDVSNTQCGRTRSRTASRSSTSSCSFVVTLRRRYRRSYAVSVGLSWPLTGRSEEMRLVEAALSDGDSSGIVICGAAGVGKSRVAREALDSAESRGCVTHWAVGTSCARTLPLGAFTAWVQSDGADTVQLVRGVIESLTATARGTTAVVGVDDVHLLDDLSTFVLHQIVQRRAAKVVLTLRDGEPISAGTQELWKAGEFERLDLQPLPPDETTTLLSAALGGSMDVQAASRLWELVRGNVLYLRHIVEQEVADGRLEHMHGFWHWTGDPIMPCSLVELIESRIGALPAAPGAVIDALAVGEPIKLEALKRIAGTDAVEDADTRGLITLNQYDSGIEVRVAHPLYGEVRRKRAAPTKLRRLRGMVAAELAAADDRDDIQIVIRRATLSVDSDLPPDVGLLCNAAHGAIWLADLSLADRLAEAAVHAGAGPEAQFLRAHALSWLGRGEEAEAVLADVPITQLTDTDHARLTYLRASNMLWALANPARAKMIIDDASRTTASHARGWIDALLTVYWFAMDRPDAATQASKALALDNLPPIVGTETAWALAAMSADAGRAADAVALARTGYTVATRCFDAPHMRFNIADAHLSAHLLAGRISEALDVAERVRQQAADLPGAAESLGAAVAGRAALGAGNLDTSCALLEKAAAALSASGHAIGWGYRYHVPYTTALAIRGCTGEAVAVLGALDKLRRPFRSLDYELSVARAWVSASQGAINEAISILQAAAATAAGNGRFAAEVMCLQTATQFGFCSGTPRLYELEKVVDGPRVGLAARFAGALRDGDAAELSAVSTEFEAMGDLVAAVDAAAHAAMAYRRRDLRGSALASITRADALEAQCGGAETPALRQAREPLPLTDREREIVMLVAGGMSNRDIAARLHVSVRTVEGHIYKAMNKTGTANREEVAALLPKGMLDRSDVLMQQRY
jgi:DNA-binding CsgD family transcriptional regulator